VFSSVCVRVTSIQQVQFVLDGLTSLPFAYFWYAGDSCRGSIRAWAVGNAAGLFLLFLFIQFARADRKRERGQPKKTDGGGERDE
jgi:hypothetical protein